jgi:hypothetical protein
MNVTYMGATAFRHTLQESWEKWRKLRRYYPTCVQWGCRYAKRSLQVLFSREEADRRRDRDEMENFNYSAIYDVLQAPGSNNEKALSLKRIKAKIIRLNSTHQHAALVDIGDRDRLRGEGMSLHHLLQGRKRRRQRTIQYLYDQDCEAKSTTADTLRVFTDYFKQKYDRCRACVESMTRLVSIGIKIIPEGENSALEEPITLDELEKAIRQSKPNKAWERDGICTKFYKAMWGTVQRYLPDIINEMCKEGQLSAYQNRLHRPDRRITDH